MINWNSFENILTGQFESYVLNGTDEETVAAFIAAQYNVFALTGGDIAFKNPVIRGNVGLLIAFIKLGFIRSKIENDISFFIDGLKKGVENYWTGAQLAPAYPPPGTVGIVSNIVIDSGTFPDVNFISSQSHQPFADRLTSAFRTHLLTLKGETIALVPQPTGPPIPAKFPWSGYN